MLGLHEAANATHTHERIAMTESFDERFAEPVIDPVHNIIYRGRGWQALNAIFAPKNVAVIGASERAGSVGRTILWNLISNPFGGAVFPVNPKRSNVLGIKAYPTIRDVPEKVDLIVVITPATSIPDIIGECVEARSSSPPGSRRSGRRVPSWSARFWSTPTGEECASSAPTAWA
jgi:hypothetical protein